MAALLAAHVVGDVFAVPIAKSTLEVVISSPATATDGCVTVAIKRHQALCVHRGVVHRDLLAHCDRPPSIEIKASHPCIGIARVVHRLPFVGIVVPEHEQIVGQGVGEMTEELPVARTPGLLHSVARDQDVWTLF
jgi:hypothetical protein